MNIIPYYIKDLHTKSIVSGPIVNRKSARTKAENRNLKYGAHRYVSVNEEGHSFSLSKEDKAKEQYGMFGA